MKGKFKKKNLKTNKNENTSYQNLWAKTKAVLREKFIAVNACIKKKDITTGSHRNTKDLRLLWTTLWQ